MRYFIGVIVLLCLATSAAATELAGHPRVIDADTLELEGHSIRLLGIDAPEAEQRCTRASGAQWPCGAAATWHLKHHIGEAKVICRGDKKDMYDRLLAHCYFHGEDLSLWLVLHGWAVGYDYYSLEYEVQEFTARTLDRGIWASEFTPPWQWREAH